MELARGSREFRGLGSSGDYLSKSVTSRETRWSGQWRRAGRKERERAREARSCRPRVAGVALSPGPTVLDRQRGLARGACAGGIAGRRSRWPQLGDPCTGLSTGRGAGTRRFCWGGCWPFWGADGHDTSARRHRLPIEPGRTGAQRNSHHARAARPHFSHRPSSAARRRPPPGRATDRDALTDDGAAAGVDLCGRGGSVAVIGTRPCRQLSAT